MNIIKLITVGIFTAASLAHAGDAQATTGNTILDRCTKQSDQDQAYCLAWIRLAAENAMQMKAIDPEPRLATTMA